MSYKLSVVFSLHAAFFFGTLAPFSRASDNPIAIACLRLVTLPPLPALPERRVPFFLRRMALATVLPAALPYLLPDFFLPAIEFFFFCSSCGPTDQNGDRLDHPARHAVQVIGG